MSSNRVGHAHARGKQLALAMIVPLLAACGGQATGGSGGSATGTGTSTGTGSTSTSAGGSGGSGGTTTSSSSSGAVACGCNGKSGCAVWQDVYITWYGYNDNSCGVGAEHGCNDIADPGLGPKKHMGATDGAGTYDDPSTAAASDTRTRARLRDGGRRDAEPGHDHLQPRGQAVLHHGGLVPRVRGRVRASSPPTTRTIRSPPSGCKAGKNLHIDFWMGPNDAIAAGLAPDLRGQRDHRQPVRRRRRGDRQSRRTTSRSRRACSTRGRQRDRRVLHLEAGERRLVPLTKLGSAGVSRARGCLPAGETPALPAGETPALPAL